jgi:DNA-binding PadR family transcriptional regulator
VAKKLEGCPCVGATLDKLVQPAVLAILAEGPEHGYAVVRRLGGLRLSARRKPDAAGVYKALKAMQGRGLVDSTWDAPQAGPARRQFRLTAAGRQCLARWQGTLQEYRDGIVELVGMVARAAGGTRGPCVRRRKAHATDTLSPGE